MMQNWKRNWLVVSKQSWGIWEILTQTIESLKNLHFNGLFLIKVHIYIYNTWAKKVQRNYFDGTKIDTEFEGKLTCAFKNDMRNLENFRSQAKNSDFILESKMAELNQNKNSKQPDRPDTMWKLCFTLEINEYLK